MRKCCLVLAFAAAGAVQAAWYWPFGDDEPEPPRLSELMEPASLAIDEAADLAADGKIDAAVETYRRALEALAKVESENPERAATAEFATVRNKRAYVNAAIDSLLMAQARENAKAVAVTDTTALEKKLAAKRAGRKAPPRVEPGADARPKLESQLKDYVKEERARAKEVERAAAVTRNERRAKEEIGRLLEKDPESRKAKLMLAAEALRKNDFTAAKAKIGEVLAVKPNDAPALNLRAVCEAAAGDPSAAEKTLDQAIRSNPRDYHAYYNMANLMLQARGSADVARRYYETGRAVGGPKDRTLEEAFK
jgi:tetratricopeptide (TPR) repeat protein